jgi:hypothetical protein
MLNNISAAIGPTQHRDMHVINCYSTRHLSWLTTGWARTSRFVPKSEVYNNEVKNIFQIRSLLHLSADTKFIFH